jgi:hypothetical protein
MLKEEVDHIIENVFEDNIKKEAVEIIDMVFKTKKHENQLEFIKKNCQDKKEIFFRFDYIKSLLIKEGIMQKQDKDYFGKIETIDFDLDSL